MITLLIDNRATRMLTDKNEEDVKKWLYKNFPPETEVKVFIDGELDEICQVNDIFNEV